jgi:hypothetical protein
MSNPSRKSEIRRRRTRKEKVALLRNRYATAKTDADRKKILERLQKVAKGMSSEQFLKPIEARQKK